MRKRGVIWYTVHAYLYLYAGVPITSTWGTGVGGGGGGGMCSVPSAQWTPNGLMKMQMFVLVIIESGLPGIPRESMLC